jgi:hypothetical protein
MTIFCSKGGRSELLITYKNQDDAVTSYFKQTLPQINNFTLLKRAIPASAIRSEVTSNGATLQVPLTPTDFNSLEADNDPYGAFSVHPDEPRSLLHAFYETISLDGLAQHVRLVRRNCFT